MNSLRRTRKSSIFLVLSYSLSSSLVLYSTSSFAGLITKSITTRSATLLHEKKKKNIMVAAAIATTSGGDDFNVDAAAGQQQQRIHDVLNNNKNEIMSLQDFLIQQKAKPTNHLVIGNEAGDADSIVSAITLAYIESVLPIATDNDSSTTTTPKKTPIVSIPRQDLETQRPETTFLLDLAGTSTENLIYVDDPFLKNDIADDNDNTDDEVVVDVTLVDHNCLCDELANKGWKVVEILDHHYDQGEHLDTCPSNDRVIAFANDKATAASTCTLVAERLRRRAWNNDDDNIKDHCHYYYPADVAVLLLGTILLDSVNMNPKAGKGTPRDAAAIQSLLDHTRWEQLSEKSKQILKIGQESKQPDTSALFDALQSAKFNIEFWKSLSIRDRLRLDYKQFASNSHIFGVSTVLMSRDDFLGNNNQEEDVVTSIEKYMVEMKIHFLGIMLSFRIDDAYHRQLILCGLPGFPLDGLVDYLVTTTTTKADSGVDQDSPPPLSLTELVDTTSTTARTHQSTRDDDGGGGLIMRFFEQGNPKASRKQVAPILMQFFVDTK